MSNLNIYVISDVYYDIKLDQEQYMPIAIDFLWPKLVGL